ncbi:riboflavin kinase [Roseinatronobacter sp. NSM]|uniref:riboflavin kinase n=1 Tax=Roseinatronobacter sp. NSM TaxID=3457785 RepID=UPI004036A305
MNMLPIRLRGVVAHGDKRGRVLGFPTANINGELPGMEYGVYASETRIESEDKIWLSVTSYGTRPTFEGADQRIETHILDFKEDIYGREIEVLLTIFIRPELRFTSVDELVATMCNDLTKVRELSAHLSKELCSSVRRIGLG